MLAIPFEGSRPIAKPKSMKDEQCSSLEIMALTDGSGYPCMVSCWQPNKEDKEAIAAGRPVWLKIIGQVHPPVALLTLDENGDANV